MLSNNVGVNSPRFPTCGLVDSIYFISRVFLDDSLNGTDTHTVDQFGVHLHQGLDVLTGLSGAFD